MILAFFIFLSIVLLLNDMWAFVLEALMLRLLIDYPFFTESQDEDKRQKIHFETEKRFIFIMHIDHPDDKE